MCYTVWFYIHKLLQTFPKSPNITPRSSPNYAFGTYFLILGLSLQFFFIVPSPNMSRILHNPNLNPSSRISNPSIRLRIENLIFQVANLNSISHYKDTTGMQTPTKFTSRISTIVWMSHSLLSIAHNNNNSNVFRSCFLVITVNFIFLAHKKTLRF